MHTKIPAIARLAAAAVLICPFLCTNAAAAIVTGLGTYAPSTQQVQITSGIGGPVDNVFIFGPVELGWRPVAGDWNSDGADTIGLYKDGAWLLKNTNSAGTEDLGFSFGPLETGWQPVVGDWNSDNVDTIGLYKDGAWLLKNTNSAGTEDFGFSFGPLETGWQPVVGDWNNDGVDTIGLYKDGTWLLRDTNTTGPADLTITFGGPTELPIVFSAVPEPSSLVSALLACIVALGWRLRRRGLSPA
jgi:hypothetical protein